MNISLAKNWWVLVIRGLVAIALGIVTFAWPGITVAALVLVFGAYCLVDGAFSLVGAFRAVRAHERWGALVLEGIAGIVAAILTLLWPAVTAFVLVIIVAAWALVTGSLEIVAAIRLRQHVAGEWLLGLSGLASILFGILCMILPLIGALAIAFCIGIYAMIFGVLLIALGLRLRTWTRTAHAGTGMPLAAH